MSDESVESMLNQMETSEPGTSADSYVPMPVEPEKKKPREFSGEIEGIKDAAREVAKAREERGITDADPTDRSWRWITGDRAGQPVDQKVTLTEDQAADGLIAARAQDVQAKYPAAEELAAKVEAARQEYQQHQQGQQPPAPEQPQPAEAQQQQQTEPQDPNAELIRVLEQHPQVREALAAEVAQVEQSRQAYQQASLQAAQLSAAALFSFAPELANMSAQELPGALRLIAQQSPERAAAIQGHIQRTQNLYQASQEAAKQQEAITQQQTARWAKSQDDAYSAMTKDDTPELKTKLGKEAIAMLKEYGASDDEISAAWNSAGPFRSAVGQRILRDAAAYRIAQREVVNKIDRSTVPVQRPGVSGPRDDGGVAQALARFNANPTPQNGAALLGARRAARR
jgi:hypothetical protein